MVEEAGLGELGEVARVRGAFACGGTRLCSRCFMVT
jgi:hypothetical protein